MVDDSAKEAGIVLLNELGLDPGIDHASAMGLIEQARATGSKVSTAVRRLVGGILIDRLSDLIVRLFLWWTTQSRGQ